MRGQSQTSAMAQVVGNTIPQPVFVHSSKMVSKIQKWCLTWNNYAASDICITKRALEHNVEYAIFGEEVGENGTKHLQGFINWGRKNRKTFGQMKTLFPKCHLEKAVTGDDANRTYCSKEGAVCIEIGTPCTPGKRTDLQQACNHLQKNKSIKRLAYTYPDIFIKYHRGFERYLELLTDDEERSEKTMVFVLTGPPGSGKSKFAFDHSKQNYKGVYYKPRGDWWDGYADQEAVVIDDFYGWMKYDEMLKICDRYPYRVPIKGGYRQFTAKAIYITSNRPVEQWYRFEGYDPAALLRRIDYHYVDTIPTSTVESAQQTEPADDILEEAMAQADIENTNWRDVTFENGKELTIRTNIYNSSTYWMIPGWGLPA